MLKRILIAACFAVLAAGCGTTQGGTTTSGSSGTSSHTTSSSSTGTTSPVTSSTGGQANSSSTGSGTTTSQTTSGNTTSSSTTGSTGSTGSVCANVTDISTLRGNSIPQFTQVCLSNVTTVVASSYGNPKPDGGTQFKGNYYVADSNGNLVNVFKNNTNGPFTFNPSPGDTVNVTGKLEVFPRDGGQVEITGFPTSTLDVTSVGSGTLPTPDTITDLADLTDANQNEIGRYVLVPAGSYTEDAAAAPFHFVASGACANGCQDGVGISDGTHDILVETFTYKHSGDTSCYPADGGYVVDLTAGNFKGVTDIVKGNDDALHKVVFLVNCGL